jgi:hypothetical protein
MVLSLTTAGKNLTLDQTATPLFNQAVYMLCAGDDVQCYKQNKNGLLKNDISRQLKKL